ncbi:MAG: hypothetical protein ACREDL_17320 [Bradyrhizobium sp.]
MAGFGETEKGITTVTSDALGNPTGFFVTGGEAHDLIGADHLLPQL